MDRPWFAQKQFGIGLSPASPAGWITMAVFIAVMTATGPIVMVLRLPVWVIWISFAAEIAVLLWVVFAKSDGKPWRWRWGDRS